MSVVIEQLQELGFSQYEAQAYVSLLKENPLNGYELAKRSGIPRPSIYPVLQRLEERGAIRRVETPEGARYAPVPAQELIYKLNQDLHRAIETASASLSEITSPPTIEYTQNFRGYAELLTYAHRMLETASSQALVALWPEEAGLLAEPLQQAQERGVHLVTLCLNGCDHPCPYCRGNIFRFQLAPTEQARWLVLVTDQAEMLAGEITPGQETLAVCTRQKMLVSLTAGYIRNSIALARILTGLGGLFDGLLDSETQADLNSIQGQEHWLDTMRELIHAGGNPGKE